MSINLVSDNSDHLFIWNAIKNAGGAVVTPPKTLSEKSLSVINYDYHVSLATQLFGPCGLGWGYDIIKEEIINGAALYKDSPQSGFNTLHVIQVKLWYIKDGKRGEVSHYGQTILTSIDEMGYVSNDEKAPQKSLKEAVSKCLAMLGFS